MKHFAIALVVCLWLGAGLARAAEQPLNGPMFVNLPEIKWQKIVPELGEGSPEIAFLRVDPKTQATQLMIRVPKDFYVPKHWHSANETHTVVSGTFIIECEGKRVELGPAGFNYVPAKMAHRAWTKANEGTLLFITVDSAWDINWVEPLPWEKEKKAGTQNSRGQ